MVITYLAQIFNLMSINYILILKKEYEYSLQKKTITLENQGNGFLLFKRLN